MRQLRRAESQWIFPGSALLHTPSVQDGIKPQDELLRRKVATGFLRSLAFRTNLVRQDQHNSHTAKGLLQVGAAFIHRFYMRRSLLDFPEPVVAATVFFLASKVEEEPVKLRHIVNACLDKFEHLDARTGKHWDPYRVPDPGPSKEYRRWENEILALEEIILEALCFDMTVEQPWVLLQRSLRGVDDLWISTSERGLLGEANIAQIGWTILNELSITPLIVLFHPLIIAYSTFTVLVALLGRVSLKEAYRISAELGWKFTLDVFLDEAGSVAGEDAEAAKLCVETILGYCKSGLIDPDLVSHLPADTVGEEPPYTRRFRPPPSSAIATTGQSAADDGTVGNKVVKSEIKE